MNTRIAIAADDNTGATDAAGMLTSFGARALLILDSSLIEELRNGAGKGGAKKSPEEYDVVVLSTRIRSIAPEEAYTLTYKVLKGLGDWGFDILQLKYCSTFDSTPEGNIGRSLDAAQDLLGFSSTIVCPALPVNGRTTYKGYHFVHDHLLSESPLATHPLNPMTDSNLLRWLGYQTQRGIGLVKLETIRSGTSAVAEERKNLEAKGAVYHVCDALEQEDIDLTVEACVGRNIPEEGPANKNGIKASPKEGQILQRRKPVFLSGGSGVSLSLGRLYYSDSPPLDFSRKLRELSPVLVVISGSESPTAQRQREYAKAHGFAEVTVNPLDILEGVSPEGPPIADSSIVAPTAERIAAPCREGKSVVVSLERDNGGSVEEVNKAAQKRGLGPVETGELIGTYLGKIAARLVHIYSIDRLLVAGGETSGAVCRECGFKALEAGLPIDPGVPYCFPVDFSSSSSTASGDPEFSAEADTLPMDAPLVILKSGNFGREDLYPRAASLGNPKDYRG